MDCRDERCVPRPAGRGTSRPAGSPPGTVSMIRREKPPPARLTAIQVVQHAIDPAYVPFDPFYDRPDKYPKAINEGELYQYTIELWPTCERLQGGTPHTREPVRVGFSAPRCRYCIRRRTPSLSMRSTRPGLTSHRPTTTTRAAPGNGSAATPTRTSTCCQAALPGAEPRLSAASYRGTTAGLAAEIMGLLGIMLLPMSIIMLQRRIRRRKRA